MVPFGDPSRCFKTLGIGNYFLPIVFSLFVGEEFAPFEHTYDDEVGIRRAPEVRAGVPRWGPIVQVFLSSSDEVISKISGKQTANYHHAAKPISSRH